MDRCECKEQHRVRRIVLTGGPGAGKTSALEMIRASLCEHVKTVPEAAGIVFGRGFQRATDPRTIRAAQQAIFLLQRDLEAAAESVDTAIALCDRGTIDAAAYWPDADPPWPELETTLEDELQRYTAVIHLRTPRASRLYNNHNPLRTESHTQAAVIDDRIAEAWAQHPRRFVVDESDDFAEKVTSVLSVVLSEMPDCCGRLRQP